MPGKLTSLLAHIDPVQTYDDLNRRADEALNTFDMPSGAIEEWYELQSLLARFMQHLDYHLLRLPEPMAPNPQFAWDRLLPILRQIYGQSGLTAAVDVVRSGAEGGSYGLLKAVAQGVARQYAENMIRASISVYWNGLSIPEKLAAPDEYLSQFAQLLPEELVGGSAVRVRADFPKVLEEHIRLLERMRLGRRR